MTETTLLWNYGNNELWRMCKDYTSLEKASFIIRLWLLALKFVLLPLSLWQSGLSEKQLQQPWLMIEKGENTEAGCMCLEKSVNLEYGVLSFLTTLKCNRRWNALFIAGMALKWCARWREHLGPLDGVRTHRRALGLRQKQDNNRTSGQEDSELRALEATMQFPARRPQRDLQVARPLSGIGGLYES